MILCVGRGKRRVPKQAGSRSPETTLCSPSGEACSNTGVGSGADVPTVLPVCLFFGLAETVALRLPVAGVAMSSYVLSALSYMAVIFVLDAAHAFASVHSSMPQDLRAVF